MFFKPKEDILELIHKQAKLSAEFEYALRLIERGKKELVIIEDFLNNVLELKELSDKISRNKGIEGFNIGLAEVKIENNRFLCREPWDKNEKKKFY